MEVILLEKMRKLGALGDKVNVKAGYARNFLIPQSKAVYANKANLIKFEQGRVEFEQRAAEHHAEALVRQKEINELPVITLTAKAGEEGKLFGSIGVRDILDALNKAGIAIQKREIHLPKGALRMTGQYEITIELESDLTAIVKINIVPAG